MGDGDRGVFVLPVVSVGGLEGARAVALDWFFGEEVCAAGDEAAAAAEVDVEAVAGDLSRAADEDHDEDGSHCTDGYRGQGPAPAPADRGQHGQSGEQGEEAR